MGSKIDVYNELLLKFSKIPKEEREMTFLELCHYPGERFEEICSRILEFFFQPNSKHGFHDLWFKALCHLLNLEYEDLSEMYTRTEEYTYSAEQSNKKIDIVLETHSMVVAIENKIGADLYNPLDSYQDHINKTYGHKIIKLVVLTAHSLSSEEREKAKKYNFTIIEYKKLFKQVKEMLGSYISKCDQNYLSFMLDFIKTVENRMNIMGETRLDAFFIENKEELARLVNEFTDWEKRIRNVQSEPLTQIKNSITQKTNNSWWIYQNWDLGVVFNDKTPYKIGIESEFKQTKDDPIGEFHIYLTTWNLSCWKPYEREVLSEYPIDENHILDDGKNNKFNRVYYHMPIIRKEDYKDDYIAEIVKRLEEYFLFLQKISSNK